MLWLSVPGLVDEEAEVGCSWGRGEVTGETNGRRKRGLCGWEVIHERRINNCNLKRKKGSIYDSVVCKGS